MVGAQIGTLGYPLLNPIGGQVVLDHRAESRFVCTGRVSLDLQGGVATLRGELLDVSANGFRVSFSDFVPATGTELEFSHQFFQGRARVMWTLQDENHFEAGCMVLRD